MRLVPQSLFGRLLVFLMGGLSAAQLLSASILLYDRGQELNRMVGIHAAQRIASLVVLFDTLPEAERQRVVNALDLPPLRISLTLPWLTLNANESWQGGLLEELLRRQLPGRSLRAAVTDLMPPFRRAQDIPSMPPPYHRLRHGHSLAGKDFYVQVELRDKSIVTFRHQLPEEVFAWPYRLLFFLLVLLISVAALSALAVRWLTRPLAQLAAAATELGRDINRPPLAEIGPLEAQRAAKAFNTMQSRLIRYVRSRGRILAAISHDLKTPITRLRLRTELLDNEGLKTKFQSDLDEMEKMVQATLDFMRGTEDREAIAPVDINALLESLQENAAETGGAVRISGPVHTPYRGRPLALKRCLSNLLDNALRYGRRAFIQVDDQAERLRIIISDDGPGIPEAELEKVFEPFYRLESSRSRYTGGTGLGLGIARNIARAHGGELTLRNGAKGGLQAVLELPR
jgi:signal transduction histidine kinase